MKSGRRESQFSHWTIALSDQFFLILLGLAFGFHLLLAYVLPPAEDELYYWTWSQVWSLSYFDHPPMVAWWIRLSTALFGNHLVAIRLPALLTHFYIFYRLGVLSEKKTVPFLLLLTPLSLFGAIFMTPDIPLLLFWFLYLEWSIRLETSFSNWSDDPVTRVYRKSPISAVNWTFGGVLLGLGLLSKYTMAIAPLCLISLLLFNFRFRAWIRGYFLHLVIAFLVFLPVLVFNYENHFSPFLFQWNHTQQPVAFNFLWTFLGSQILLMGALPFLFLPGLLLSISSLSRFQGFRSLFYFFIIPLGFFLIKSTHHFLEANWSLVAYLSFWPLASYFISFSSFKVPMRILVGISFVVPLCLSGILLIHSFYPLSFIPAGQDRLEKLRAQNELVKQVTSSLESTENTPFFTSSYQWTSYFKFHGIPQATQIKAMGRPSHFTIFAQDPCLTDQAYAFIPEGTLPEQLGQCFPKAKIVQPFTLSIRGNAISQWQLWKLDK